MSEEEKPTTRELRARQQNRETSERDAVGDAETPAGERQHRRRADKAAYLKQKLAERERAEREADEPS